MPSHLKHPRTQDTRAFELRDGVLVVCDGRHDPHHPCTWRPADLFDQAEHQARLDPDGPSIFNSTQAIAGQIAAGHADQRYAQILAIIERRGDATLAEIAAELRVTPNQISGRITELLNDFIIEPTGARRPNPKTGSPCRVYHLRATQDSPLPS